MTVDEHKPLVSIVSPVFNGEKFVGRMLASVLSQSYPNIEMICVDDGSEDGTEKAVLSFSSAFREKNMRLVYTRQPHKGQAAAINCGLKLVNGEYLSWVDSDDFLVPSSIEAKLSALIANHDYDVATSDFYVVDESNPKRVLRRQGDLFGSLNFQSRQFYLALLGRSIIEANCHLVRMSCFDEAFPERELVDCREGQNYQLMLPLYFKYKRLYVDQPLAYYVIRSESHYHRQRSEEEWAARYDALMEMLEHVLGSLGISALEIKKLVKMSCFNQER